MSVSADESETDGNYVVFKDCLSSAILEQYATGPQRKRAKRPRKRAQAIESLAQGVPENGEVDLAELADFIEYLSTEVFTSLPHEARTLSYSVIQNNPTLSEKYSAPLSLSTLESLLEPLPTSISDTLTTYALIQPPRTDLLTFLTPVLTTYLTTLLLPPPPWHLTRPTACELCARDHLPLTYHHLIPRSVQAKALKRGWHEEHMLNKVAWLCRACHSFVHRMAGNEELAREWHEVGLMMEREDVQAWVRWVGGVRWKKR